MKTPDVKRKSIERPRAGIKDRAKPDPEQDENAERDARQGIVKSPEVIRQDGANLHNQRGDKSAEQEVRRRSGIRPGNTRQEKTRWGAEWRSNDTPTPNQMESTGRDLGPDITERSNETPTGEVKRESQTRREGNRRGDTRRTSDEITRRRRRAEARSIRMTSPEASQDKRSPRGRWKTRRQDEGEGSKVLAMLQPRIERAMWQLHQ